MSDQVINMTETITDNRGELTKYVRKCERLLGVWDENIAEELVNDVTRKYKIVFSSSNIFEQVHEIYVQLMFALKYL